jgi:hypothetical protein
MRGIYNMKTKKLILITATLVMACPVFAQFTGDGFKNTVVGSKHDLSATATSGLLASNVGQITGTTAVCEFCHAPHKIQAIAGSSNGYPTTATAPPMLWNLQVKTVSYPTYGNSPTLAASDIRDPSTAGPGNQAAYMSLLCLSCHDGSITAASFYYTDVLGTVGTITPPNIGNSSGAGLANDHPVDFTYSASLAATAGGLQTPLEGASVRIAAVGKTKPLPLFKDQPTSPSGRVECATCHNPHDNTTYNGGNYFMRMDNFGSALCLNCHGN